MASDLKPCPFCGGAAGHMMTGDPAVWHRIQCDTCFASVVEQHKHLAAIRWNRRTPADLAARVEAERVACADVCKRRAHTDYGDTVRVSAIKMHEALACETLIRALGPTPAYDAAIKAARTEGMEDADTLRAAVEYAFTVDRETFDGMQWLKAWWTGDPTAMSELAAIRAAKDQPA